MEDASIIPVEAIVPREERGTISREAHEYGRSVEGAPLLCWPAERESTSILVYAAIHGDEPCTTTVLSDALRSIRPGFLAAHVVLSANPDGLARGTRANANGVDLNRNFPTTDWSADGTVFRWNADSPRDVRLSTGTQAGSEPEARHLISLIENLQPTTMIALHAPLACIEDPVGSPLGVWLADVTGLPLVADVGYATPGSAGTWSREHGHHLITYEFDHESAPTQAKRHGDPLLRVLLGVAGGRRPLSPALAE